MTDVRIGHVIQIKGDHKWSYCLAIVSEMKTFGVVAVVRAPVADGVADYSIRLEWDEFEALGGMAAWLPDPA